MFKEGSMDNFNKCEFLFIVNKYALNNKGNISGKMKKLYLQSQKKKTSQMTIASLIMLLDASFSDCAIFIQKFNLNRSGTISKYLRESYYEKESKRVASLSIDLLFDLLSDQNIQEIKTFAFNNYMDYIKQAPKVVFPLFVSDDITNKILKSKCGIEQDFLTNQSKDLLNILAKEIQLDNYLSLSKNDLCEAIMNVNTIARVATNKSLLKCNKGILELQTQETESNSENPGQKLAIKSERESLNLDILKLNELLTKWDSLDVYQDLCEKDANGNCVNVFKSLHIFANMITTQADRCNASIKSLKRKLKISNILKEDSTWKKFKANFF